MKELKKSTQEYEGTFERKLGDFMLQFDTIVLDEEDSEEEEEAYPELTDEYQGVIKRVLYGGSRSEVCFLGSWFLTERAEFTTLRSQRFSFCLGQG